MHIYIYLDLTWSDGISSR